MLLRPPPCLALARRHEVPGGGHVVHCEGQGATAPAAALLRGAERRPFLTATCEPGGGVARRLARSGGRRRTRCGWRRRVAAVAMAPLALVLVVWLPSALTSSTTKIKYKVVQNAKVVASPTKPICKNRALAMCRSPKCANLLFIEPSRDLTAAPVHNLAVSTKRHPRNRTVAERRESSLRSLGRVPFTYREWPAPRRRGRPPGW